MKTPPVRSTSVNKMNTAKRLPRDKGYRVLETEQFRQIQFVKPILFLVKSSRRREVRELSDRARELLALFVTAYIVSGFTAIGLKVYRNVICDHAGQLGIRMKKTRYHNAFDELLKAGYVSRTSIPDYDQSGRRVPIELEPCEYISGQRTVIGFTPKLRFLVTQEKKVNKPVVQSAVVDMRSRKTDDTGKPPRKQRLSTAHPHIAQDETKCGAAVFLGGVVRAADPNDHPIPECCHTQDPTNCTSTCERHVDSSEVTTKVTSSASTAPEVSLTDHPTATQSLPCEPPPGTDDPGPDRAGPRREERIAIGVPASRRPVRPGKHSPATWENARARFLADLFQVLWKHPTPYANQLFNRASVETNATYCKGAAVYSVQWGHWLYRLYRMPKMERFGIIRTVIIPALKRPGEIKIQNAGSIDPEMISASAPATSAPATSAPGNCPHYLRDIAERAQEKVRQYKEEGNDNENK